MNKPNVPRCHSEGVSLEISAEALVREIFARYDPVIFCVERKSGGVYQTMKYTEKQKKDFIKLNQVS